MRVFPKRQAGPLGKDMVKFPQNFLKCWIVTEIHLNKLQELDTWDDFNSVELTAHFVRVVGFGKKAKEIKFDCPSPSRRFIAHWLRFISVER